MNRNISSLVSLVSVGVVLFVFSCTTIRQSQTAGSLPERVEMYHKALRWDDYSKASAFVSDIEDFEKKVKNAAQPLKVIDYSIEKITFNADKTEAVVEVKRSYMLSSGITAYNQNLEQKWKYDTERKDWFLVTPY